MKLISLDLSNIFNYSNQTINFDGLCHKISGDNGKGKTNLLSSIIISLYGKTPFKEDRRQGRMSIYDIIHFNKDNGKIILKFEHNNLYYKIERIISKKGRNKHECYITQFKNNKFKEGKLLNKTGNGQVDDALSIIEELICPYDLFVTSSVATSHNSILQSKKSSRMDIFTSLIGIDRIYNSLHEWFKQEKNVLNDDLLKLRSNLNGIEDNLKNLRNVFSNNENNSQPGNTIMFSREYVNLLDKRINKITELYNESNNICGSLTNMVIQTEQELEKVMSKKVLDNNIPSKSQIDNYYREAQSRIRKVSEDKHQYQILSNKIETTVNNIIRRYNASEAAIKSAKNIDETNIEVFRSDPNNKVIGSVKECKVCPLFKYYDNTMYRIQEQHKSLNEIQIKKNNELNNPELVSMKQMRANINMNQLEERLNTLNRKIQKMEDILNKYNTNQYINAEEKDAFINEYQTTIATCKKNLQVENKKLQKINRILDKLNTRKNNIIIYYKVIDENEHSIRKLGESIQELENQRAFSQNAILNAENRLQILSLGAEATNRYGIPSMLVTESFDSINNIVSDIIHTTFPGFDFSINLDDKNNIPIGWQDGQHFIDSGTLSTGQAGAIVFGMMIAMSVLNNIGIVLCDEFFDSLKDERRQTLSDSLAIITENYNVQILYTTHSGEISAGNVIFL